MRISLNVVVVLAVLNIMVCGSAQAQQAVSRSLVNGKAVTLFDNGTWTYESSDQQRCRSLGSGISFCGASDIWKNTTSAGPDAAATFRYDDRHYAMVIVEALGVADGVTQEYMRSAVVENAATGGDVASESVVVIGIESYEGFAYPSETVVYSTQINGLDAIFANTIVTKLNQTFQLITFAVGSQYTQQHRHLNDDFVKSFELD